jgi:hypothetical protein
MWTYVTGKPTLADTAIGAEVARQRLIMGLVGCSAYLIGIGISFISPLASLCIYGLAVLLSIIITWKDSHGYLSKVFMKMRRKSKKKALRS